METDEIIAIIRKDGKDGLKDEIGHAILEEKMEEFYAGNSKEGSVLNNLARVLYQKSIRCHFGDNNVNVETLSNDLGYLHNCIAHSFYDFLEITGVLDECNPNGKIKKAYDSFAKINNIPLNARDKGLQEYLED
jgi:hypothetical protein